MKNPLAGERLQPLGHLSTSVYAAESLKLQGYSGFFAPGSRCQILA